MVTDPSSVRRAASFAAIIAACGIVGTAALATQVELPMGAQVRSLPARSREGPRATSESVQSLPRSASELHDTLAARMRLRPDRRVLMALTELQRLVDSSSTAAEARWRAGRWQVLLGSTVSGTLPENPEFEDLVALVSDVAAALTPLHPLRSEGAPSDASVSPMLAPSRSPMAVLTSLDVAWSSGSRTPETLSAAARALAALALETPDTVDAADLVAARALAALSWARSVGHGDPEGEAVLARTMHYDDAARRIADTLPETSPVRAWIRRDDDVLRAMALSGDANETARYLWFRRLVERRDGGSSDAWAERQLRDVVATVPVVGFLLDAHRDSPVEGYRPLAHAQAARALHALEREVAVDAPIARTSAEILPRLVALSARRTTQGAFLDRDLATARDRAVVLSALHDELAFSLEAGLPDALALVDALGQATPEPVRDFVLWATHVAYVRAGTLATDVLTHDLTAPLSLGAAPFALTCDAALRTMERDDLRARASVERLAARFDSRPSHRAQLALRAGDALHDLALTESLCGLTLRSTPTTDEAAWCLARKGDRDALLALARDTTLPVARRVLAADLATNNHGAPADGLDSLWRSLADAAPDAWSARHGYAKWLSDEGRADEALALADAWLRLNRDGPPSEVARARTDAARLLRARGDAQAALRMVEPSLRGLDVDLLGEAALALADLGRFDDAERVATASLEHHHSARAVTLAAEILWRRNAYERAARTIAQSGVSLTDDDWRALVADAFARVFSNAAVEGARSAMGALVASALSLDKLLCVPRELHRRGRSDLATVTLAAISAGRQRAPAADGVGSIVQEYVYRRALGADAALTWARARLTPELHASASVFAYAYGADDLLWSVIEPSGADDDAERVWLMRAAASVRAGPREPHRNDIVEHYNAGGASERADMGRYLLGQAPLPAMLSLARAPRLRAEVAYYIGLRAHADGRVAEASDWYQLSTMIGDSQTPEVMWAREARDAWYERSETLARIAQRPWGTRATVHGDTPPEAIDADPEEPAPPDAAAPSGRRHHPHATHGGRHVGRHRRR